MDRTRFVTNEDYRDGYHCGVEEGQKQVIEYLQNIDILEIALELRNSINNTICRRFRADGNYMIREGNTLFDPNGKMINADSSGRDITPPKRGVEESE